MTRITHFKQQPVNIQYWDYYILCRLNTDATIALQRLEYWDGTKEDSNFHAENINETLEQQGQPVTQDISNWIYKAQDELQWELMGVAGEKRLPRLINFLMKDVEYLESRNNPANTWDRKKQYGFKAKTIQDHINYLGYVVAYFDLPLRRLTPVFYAIEMLTREKVYIDTLNANLVLAKIESFREDEKIPHFLKMEIEKFFQSFQKPSILPFRTFAEWKAQSCGMHTAKVRNGKRSNAESIPQNRGSNSIEFKTENTNREDKHKGGTNALSDDERLTPSPLSENAFHPGNSGLHIQQGRQVGNDGVTSITLEEMGTTFPSSSAESTQEKSFENNRLTSPPTPLVEQNVSTDESLARIERETANHPSSSLVVDSPNAEMIHADARNTTNSYSPHSTVPSAIPETVQSDGEEVTLAEKSAQPVGKGTGRGSKKKPKVDLDKVKPLPRPERPSDEMPWNAKKLLAWGDYFRGHTIPFSERANSRYQWAEQSAIALIERNIEEKHFLAVMRFMRGVNLKLEPDLEFRDDWWPTHQLADLWDAEKHFDNMLNKARQTLKNRKQNAQAKAGVASTMMTPQTRQPENQLKAPEGWTARRTAEGGR